MNKLVWAALAFSLALNVVLWFQMEWSQQLEPLFNVLPSESTAIVSTNPYPSVRSTQQNSPAVAITPKKTTIKNDSWQQTIIQLMQVQDFISAIDLYEDKRLLDEQQVIAINEQWLATIKTWIEQQQFVQTEQFLTAYLARFPYDLSILILQAELNFQRGQRQLAIEQFHHLLDLTYTPAEEQQVQQRLQQQVTQYQQQAAGQWPELIELFEQLLIWQPQAAPYKMALAKAFIQQDNFNAAEPLLIELLADNTFAQQAENLLAQWQEEAPDPSDIPLKKLGQHFLVAARLLQDNPVTLMIDTGASLSVLSSNYFQQLNYQQQATYRQHTQVNTAGGIVRAPIYEFPEFSLGPYTLTNFQFIVLTLEPIPGAQGLLGMNFLQAFNFEINKQRSILKLTPLPK